MHNCFPGFAWALPQAFTDPLGFCRFEEGDILYSSEDGYKPWNEAIKVLQWSLQVTSPARASAGALKEDEGAVFSRNWTSPVTFNLTHYQAVPTLVETISTTQGRLYSFLRTGDFACLDSASEAPPMPLLIGEANKCLDKLEHGLLKGLCEGLEKPHTFLMAYDPCNAVSRAKVSEIRRCLSHYEGIREKDFTPHDLGLTDAHKFAPTVKFCAFVVDTNATEKMRDCLKKVLYKPNKKNENTVDKFKLSRHGLFIPHKAKAEKEGLVNISFAHGSGHFYRFRLDSNRAKKTPVELQEFFKVLTDGDCPNHLFLEKPTSSGLTLALNKQISRDRNHSIIDKAGASYQFEKYKSTHENLQVYFLENFDEVIASEVPLWMSAEEYPDYKAIFPEGGTLTGHIDLLHFESDGKVWIWDFKPNAFEETYATGQVYSYAVMLSVRTGLPLEQFRCGYFDASNAYVFEPAKIILGSLQGSLL